MSDLNNKQILGASHELSENGKQRLATFQNATTAREAADIESLYAAYEQTVIDRTKLEQLLLESMGMVMKKPLEVGGSHGDGITAVRDVALAAINLARDVALKGQSQERDDKGHFKPKTQP